MHRRAAMHCVELQAPEGVCVAPLMAATLPVRLRELQVWYARLWHTRSQHSVHSGCPRPRVNSRRDGVPLALGNRALDILITLVEHAGEVVSHASSIARVWRGLVVGPGNLRVHMSSLRKALGDGEAGTAVYRERGGSGLLLRRARSTRRVVRGDPGSHRAVPGCRPAKTGLPPRLSAHDRPRRDRAHDRRRSHRRTIRHHHRPRRHGQDDRGRSSVAHAMQEEFAGAVCFVDVGAVDDPTLVAATIASSLGLALQTADAVPTLLDASCDTQRILLVLDNCEHVDRCAAHTGRRRMFSEALRAFTFSRPAARRCASKASTPTGCRRSKVPLAGSSLKAADVLTFPAVKLFVERAAASGEPLRADRRECAGRRRTSAAGSTALRSRSNSPRDGSARYGIAGTAELLNKQSRPALAGTTHRAAASPDAARPARLELRSARRNEPACPAPTIGAGRLLQRRSRRRRHVGRAGR